VRARVVRVSFGKVHGTSRDYKIRILNIIFFFSLKFKFTHKFRHFNDKTFKFQTKSTMGNPNLQSGVKIS